jgi:hypothetical protein
MDDLFRVYEHAGPDGYPPEWNRTIKYEVRARAGHRCVRCHHPYIGAKDAVMLGVEKSPGRWSPCDNQCTHAGPVRWRLMDSPDVWTVEPDYLLHGDPDLVVEAEYRILTVHHLNGNKLDCRWHNLVALCQRCHLLIQGKVRMDREWIRQHSDWFKPYAAAFYAWKYLGEELTREQTEARLDELLALELREEPLPL